MYGGAPHYAWDHGRPQNFKRRLKVVGPAFLAIDKPELAKALEKGDKCVLHAGLLSELHHKMEELAISGRPMIFEALHEETKRKTHCGVLEFSGEEYNVVYMPQWMMHNLGIEDGAFIMFRMIQLPTVKYLRLRPADDSFVHSVPEPKLALEEALHSFTAVTVGDEVVIHHHDTPYHFTVLAVKPETGNKAACLVGAECELEFAGLDEFMEGAHAGAGAPAGGSSGAAAATYASQASGELGLGLGLGGAGGATEAGGSNQGLSGGGRKGSVHFPDSSPMLSGLSSGPGGGGGGGGSGRASPAAPSAPRKIEIGETLAGELRDGQSSHYFTIIVRAPYVQIPHAVRFVLNSTHNKAGFVSPPPLPFGGGASSSVGAAARPAGRTTAFDAGGMVPGLGLEPPGSVSAASGTSGAGVEGTGAPGSAGKPPRSGAGHSRTESAASAFAGGSGRVGGSSPLVATASAAPAGGGSLEADLYVTGNASLTTKPSKRLFTWAEASSSASKSLCLLPSTGTPQGLPSSVRGPTDADNGSSETLPQPNDTTGSMVLYACVEASDFETLSAPGNPSLSYTLSLEAIPLLAAGSTGGSDTPGAAQPGAASAAASAGGAPGTKQCDNCGQWVPEHTHTMHSAYCKRNISKCGVCGVSVQSRQADKHVHCPGAPDSASTGAEGGQGQVGGWPACKAVLSSTWEAQKHAAIFHSSFPCEACGQAVSRDSYPSHRMQDCPLRTVPCVYCGMSLQFKTRTEHEEKCGGRTLPCDLCSRLVPRKRMALHKESGCQLGGTGATPQTPFVRPGPARGGLELPPELAGMAADIDMDAQFALDGMPGASALGFSPSTARSLGMGMGMPGMGAGRPAGAPVPPPAARLPPIDFHAGDVEYEYHYDDDDDDDDDDEGMDLAEDSQEGHGGTAGAAGRARTTGADAVPADSDIVMVDEEGSGAPGARTHAMAGRGGIGVRRLAQGGRASTSTKVGRGGYHGARMYDHEDASSSEGEYEAAWAAAGRSAAMRGGDVDMGMGRGAAAGAGRERCPIEGCNALAEERGWEGLHLHWLTTCAANQPSASEAQKAQLQQLLEVAAQGQGQGQGAAALPPPATATATASVPAGTAVPPPALPSTAATRGSRCRLCPACGLVFQPGDQEDEVQVHVLSACTVAASGQGGMESTDWIAQIGAFAPAGSTPGSHVAGYPKSSTAPSVGGTAGLAPLAPLASASRSDHHAPPAAAASSTTGGTEDPPPLLSLGSLGLPSANLSHRAGSAAARSSVGLALGLGLGGGGARSMSSAGGSPQDDEESRMLAEALAASMHDGVPVSSAAAASGATSVHADILPRRSRPSSFHVLDTEGGTEEGEGEGEAAEREALGLSGQQQGAPQPSAPPAEAVAGKEATAGAAPPSASSSSSYQCLSCTHAAESEDALQIHMLTECEHKEQNMRILFG